MTEASPPTLLDAVTAEIEAHVAAAGWDQAPELFALVPTRLVAAEPQGSQLLGLDPEQEIPDDSLTPVAQDPLPDGALDEALAGIEWPDAVAGCALTQEIVVLPPGAEDDVPEDPAAAASVAATHPQRREARLAVAVLRDGSASSILRLRATDGGTDDIAIGADLAPNLATALLATLE